MVAAELAARSAFSLLQGASTPEQLVDEAVQLGLSHLALVDRDGVYGLPEAWRAAQGTGLGLVCGATVTLIDAPPVLLLAESHDGWSALTQLLTLAHTRGAKGRAAATVDEVCAAALDLTCLLPHGWTPDAAAPLAEAFGDHLEVLLTRRGTPQDRQRLRDATALAQRFGRPLLASSEPLFHTPSRRRLADVLTAIRRKQPLDHIGRALQPNAARVLRGPEALAAWFADHPEAVARTQVVAERCAFRLNELSYRYPSEVVPAGHTPMSWLRHLTTQGARERFPDGLPTTVAGQIAHELDIIEQLDFPSYFLTVHDIVRFARSQDILCQGRGSAANSAVCYALGITAVDPSRYRLLFERFISPERGEPPDIDVDFEHQRREEVLQYVYERYGRHRAAMVNEVITYRPRSAIRDIGKVFGLSLEQVNQLAKLTSRWSMGSLDTVLDRLDEVGLADDALAVRRTLEMAQDLAGLPRHMGIHSGGFVISDRALTELVPVEPATMEGRTVVQWDKYGIEALKFVKVDVLALGMLSAIRRSFDLIRGATGQVIQLHTVPPNDPAVYRMFQAADTVGVFQIESRAQQSMLPRLKPACFYDLVVEVAIVRPGPIQGGMVHPYLRRRNGEEPVTYAHPALEPILHRTMGVPLFQEQVMAMAVAVGGFTPGEADQLRRAMGAWRKRGNLHGLGRKLVEGMLARDIEPAFAEAIFEQIKGFGEYGFPESHAASFALLVYVSGWIKRHHPAAFCAALINAQPMGFYAPRSLVADAQRHGVPVRPIDVTCSDWDCTLEPIPGEAPALRLGLRLVRGLAEEDGRCIEAARAERPFAHLPDLARRTRLGRPTLTLLAEAGALSALVSDRRQAAWQIQGLWTDTPLFAGLSRHEPAAPLPAPTPVEHLAADYRTVGLSIADHPTLHARRALAERGIHPLVLADLATLQHGDRVSTMGLISSRQRPGTANGVLFLALEDETGLANLIVWPRCFEAHRRLLTTSTLLGVDGVLQRQDGAWSVLVDRPWSVETPGSLRVPSRDFR